MRPIAIAAVLFVLAPIAAAGSARNRAVGTVPSHGTIAVGPEYRIPANPDSPWLESVAVAAGPTSGIVVWTEDGPKSGEATIRFARLASDGHPLDAAGRLLIENGHYQRHVAIDAFGDQFVAAWCDVSDTTKKIVAMRLDASGRAIDAVPVVVADVASTSEPQVNVTCSNAGCFVTWGGNGSYGSFSVGVVTGAPIFSRSSRAAGAPLQLTPKGIGNGIGTDALNFCTAYAEEVAYGKSSALVAKVISADGSANEIPLLSSNPDQIGTTWMAWSGAQWLVLWMDLTASDGLAQEVRFLRVDGAGHPMGGSAPTLIESAGVPLLCPFVPDLFLYDPQNRRVVWDGTSFLVFTQHAIVGVGTDGQLFGRVASESYFPRGYATAVATSGHGRTTVAYSRDNAVAIRVIDDVP